MIVERPTRSSGGRGGADLLRPIRCLRAFVGAFDQFQALDQFQAELVEVAAYAARGEDHLGQDRANADQEATQERTLRLPAFPVERQATIPTLSKAVTGRSVHAEVRWSSSPRGRDLEPSIVRPQISNDSNPPWPTRLPRGAGS